MTTAFTFEGFPEDPSQPPPLLQEFPNGGSIIRYREGGRITLRRHQFSPSSLFTLTLAASMGLGGQPVRCSGFVPGVSLRISAGPFAASLSGAEAENYSDQMRKPILSIFERWLTNPENHPVLWVEQYDGGLIQFARDALQVTLPGVMQIDMID
jgi:hypothetical protein